MSNWTIRSVTTHADAHEFVAFQELIWGRDFGEIVPAAILWVAIRTGGILAGAFEDGRLVGFIFGMTGYVGGSPLHWSDMLAVLPSHRGQGMGVALKQYQRARLLEAGISRCNWTFDPLEARNARLNFNRLGGTSAEYVRDCYGESRSPLHHGLPTDRLIVEWLVDSDRVRERMDRGHRPDPRTAPAVNSTAGTLDLDIDEAAVTIVIPATMTGLSPDAALAWRRNARRAFETYFGRGFRAMEVLPDGPDHYAYLLVRQ